MEINSGFNYEEWVGIYCKIINWEIKFDEFNLSGMWDIFLDQKSEVNVVFFKYIEKNYLGWICDKDGLVMFNDLLWFKVFLKMDSSVLIILLLFDNLCYDQWCMLEFIFNEFYCIEEEDYFYSIFFIFMQYSWNVIFVGFMFLEIEQYYFIWWKNDNDEGGKNLYEYDFFMELIGCIICKELKFDYVKVINVNYVKQFNDNIFNYLNNDFIVIVYNFIDMLFYVCMEMEVFKEFVGDEKVYCLFICLWFCNF